MRRFKTLRVRFALWTAGLMLVVLALFGGFVYFSMQQGLSGAIDDSLRVNASQAISAVNIENGQINLSDSLPETSTTVDLQGRGLTIRILSTGGKVLQSVGPYVDLPIDLTTVQRATTGVPSLGTLSSPKSGPIRIYTAPITDNQQLLGVIQVMQGLGTLTQTLNRLLVALLVSIPILLIVSGLSGYLLASRTLAPIDQITRTAQRISTEDLSARLNLWENDDEIGRLAATFDGMLARLEKGFKRERQFTSDASHELRTPLAAMHAILNVTRERRRPPEEYEVALEDLSEETDRLRALTEDLLYISRSEAQPLASYEILNLSNLLVDVCESLRPMAESKVLRLENDIQPGLFINGDSDAMIRVFVNLIENAIKYTETGEVRIKATRLDRSRLEITISDTGRGIPPEHLPHIFERFYRVDSSRATQGFGLGLAIVQEIVRNHQGKIEASSVLGTGTVFRLYFPMIEPSNISSSPDLKSAR